MTIENNKPPDPLISKFYELTGMKPENVRVADACGSAPKGKEGKPRRHRHGIKVASPGSASVRASAVLRNLRSSNGSGKHRKRSESSPMDNRGGKRSSYCNIDDSSNEGLNNVKSGAMNPKLKFALGSSSDTNASRKSVDTVDKTVGNGGSFINKPIELIPLVSKQSSPVAKSKGLEASTVITSEGVVGSASVSAAGSRDSGAMAKTGIELEMAGSDSSNEHTSMEDVVNTGVPHSSVLNGIANDMGGRGFEFGNNDKAKGILKKPIGPMFSVQFGKNNINNPFVKSTLGQNGSAWNTSGINGLRKPVLSNQYTADADRFTEKLKQGSEEMALKMEYTPNAISKSEMVIGGFSFWLKKYLRVDRLVRCNFMGTLWGHLWIIECIGKIISGVGKPMVMDRMTKERCLKKAGKLDFARVLVEVNANEDLPSILEIEYPPLGNRPAKIGKLEVKYQWKPPLCTHCKTFGHTTLSCKVRPRTDQEVKAKTEEMNVSGAYVSKANGNVGDVDNEGFSTVGKRNKPVSSNVKNTGSQNSNAQNASKYGVSRGTVGKSVMSNQGNGMNQKKFQPKSKSNGDDSNKVKRGGDILSKNPSSNSKQSNSFVKKNAGTSNEPKSLHQLSKDPHFKPTLLVRGSGSKTSSKAVAKEAIPLSNAFQVLTDEEMEQCTGDDDLIAKKESDNNSWRALKEEVDLLLEAGIYPSKVIRLEWSVHQLDYFYKNCHKFQLDPSYEDDEVESDVEGIASEMKPEYEKLPDSHDHLFFECDITGKIWAKVKTMAKLHNAPSRWVDLLNYMILRPFNKSIWSMLQRIVIGASVYFVWQERNMSTFQDKFRSIEDICRLIIDTVRLRIMGLKINNSAQVLEAAIIWDLHVMKAIGKGKVQFHNGRS
ncbi:hypothetical protein CTI12_AA463000 [Artemisia annua]|uniref:Reverse transcriptase domain, Reverse transcriptase zinc-binding domain protein n=1 Tax=Artemisia annua TaxID=35608 RepID=A0A2U1LRF4_ARTAN|nr:hypothetical protein CTI12_AA463000 [Artemisia annua]